MKSVDKALFSLIDSMTTWQQGWLLKCDSYFTALPATDRVIRIKFTSCFRLTLPLLNPKALKFLTHV